MPVQINDLQARAMPGVDSASDVFLGITSKRAGKIKGEVTTSGHADDIAVFSWSWGMAANTAIGSTEATARRSYKQLVVLKGIDAATPGLMSVLATNDEVKEAKLTMRKAGGEALDYFTMTLNGARVVGVDIDVGSDGRPVERVAIAFTKIDVEYKRQQSAGIGSGSYTFNDEVMAPAG
jgi:type VI secretion system secreted protein Hcp